MKRKIKSVSDQHQDWLGQIDTEGPFLALPVVKDVWPQGVDRLGDADDRMITFKQAAVQWQRAFDEYTESARSEEAKEDYGRVNRAWIELVLDRLAGWQDLRVAEPDARLADVEITSPGSEIAVRPSGALEGRDKDLGALLLVSAPTTDLRAPGLDGWAATEIDRMAMLLRKARVEVGIVTDGQWWAIVWAKDGKPTGSGVVNALTWAEEPLLRDAFLSLIDQRRFRARDIEQRLPHLFERSELEAEVITEALGTQVRKSVELLVQAFSEARLAAVASGAQDPLSEKPDDVYQAAVTIMMRVVFVLFAEERDMLPTEQLYWSSYAINDLLDDLQQRAGDGEEHLDDTYDAWHRLLAVSEALHGGVNYDEMRMPAYGGSLLDPERFPWLHATDSRGLRLKVSDRVMLHVLDSVQSVVVKNERRRITFRDIDVEQIGYIYEGLLGYTCRVVEDDIVLGLIGKDGEEPEIPLGILQQLYDDSTSSKVFAAALTAWVNLHQAAATLKSVSVIAKVVDKDLTKEAEAEFTRLLTPVAGQNRELLEQLVDWGPLIRRDLRGIPYVVPFGGLIVGETPSRKNAGAHYTPRVLAEEVVKYALEPLVYDPGPLQTADENAWMLKSSTAILDLRVADIAAGSGAFLVAAARFLANRVTEAWTVEDVLGPEERAHPKLATERALREIIARCLYGADINPMAVEMCKLSLWLVSMDRGKPFSFVDDKILCGNSLLGITSLDQLRALHMHPDSQRHRDLLHELVNVDGKIDEAIRLRIELSSPIDEYNPMRSRRGKIALLDRFTQVTTDLRLIADAIVAIGLASGGKAGARLDEAYEILRGELAEVFAADGSLENRARIIERIDAGLIPEVETDYERWRPIHWILSTPEVFVHRDGFDAVIGNPPFLGGSKLSSSMGSRVRESLTNTIACGKRGTADLVAYFYLRASSLSSPTSMIGLVATSTVAQGVTREVGLDQLLEDRFTIVRSVRSRPWPASSAQLDIAVTWLSARPTGVGVRVICDGRPVDQISSLLERASRTGGEPLSLRVNRGIAFNGMKPYGLGFVITGALAKQWTMEDPGNIDVVFPYLTGDDVNSSPSLTTDRWIIDFANRSLDEASRFAQPFDAVRRRVKPERDKNTRQARRERWWQFGEVAPGLRRAIADLQEVLVIAQVSKTVMVARVSTRQVLDQKLIVFSSDSYSDQAILSSGMHRLWAIQYCSTLGTNSTNYSPSDAFVTFPRPFASDRLKHIGHSLDKERGEIMRRRGLGLTPLYNLVDGPTFRDDVDADRLREIHCEIDEATMAAYGWDDLRLDHGFHTYRKTVRWMVSPVARIEILDRLLELNHERAREEGQEVPEPRRLF